MTDRAIVAALGIAGRAFFGPFERLRDVQRRAIPVVFQGCSTLVASPTASGKTEAIVAPLVGRFQKSREPGPVILVVSPTRALVNDLHHRLYEPLARLGWRCGRQTGDHREKTSRPEVLITTPESFDSMLVRDGVREDGRLRDHLLLRVRAVFLDEVHSYDGSARGDQIAWLLARLRRLRAFGHRRGLVLHTDVQVCGASATVGSAARLGRDLFGVAPDVVQVPGAREIETLVDHPAVAWVPPTNCGGVAGLYDMILRTSGTADLDGLSRLVWLALEDRGGEACRKVLVFVPTRSLCDRLSQHLGVALTAQRDLLVRGHHGSLSRVERERAERDFTSRRDAVLVATTTLEVGVDIGDVDAVTLVGPPPDVSSLLQRIGRAGRRIGRTRVVPIARDEIEARAFASLLHACVGGHLDETATARRWSVLVQQVASHIAQARHRGRSRRELLALAESVWPESTTAPRTTRVLDALVESGDLYEASDRVRLGATFTKRYEEAAGGFHSNFSTDAAGLPVVDASTGEVLAHVPSQQTDSATVALAGRTWKVACQSGEFVLDVAPASDRQRESATFRYATRRAPLRESLAAHVRAGCGLGETEAPTIVLGDVTLWFHFGGAAYEVVLRALQPGLELAPGLGGLAVTGLPKVCELNRLAADSFAFHAELLRHADSLESLLSMGSHHRYLPTDMRRDVVVEVLGAQRFSRWLRTRVIRRIDPEEALWRTLTSVAGVFRAG